MEVEQDGEVELCNRVFNNEIILEKIVEHAIFRNGIIQRSVIGPVRLVNKIWHNLVAKVTQEKGQPLFQFVLDQSFCAEENERNILDEFVDAINSKSIINVPNCPPTYCLRIQPCFFQVESPLSLYNCLRQCANGLMELEVCFPKCGGFLLTTFPLRSQLSFSNLFKLIIKFTDVCFEGYAQTDLTNIFHDQVILIQFVLSRADNLKEFLVPNNSKGPINFELITLPHSVTTLNLTCKLGSGQVKKFFKVNKSQKLSKLIMRVWQRLLDNGLLYSVLNRHRSTLRNLTIIGGARSSCANSIHQFPVMESMEKFRIVARDGKKAEVDADCFRRCFPKLVKLTLLRQD